MLYFDSGCFHQLGVCALEDNLFLNRTVHKLEALSDFLFVYSETVQTAIFLRKECRRDFECLQQSSML